MGGRFYRGWAHVLHVRDRRDRPVGGLRDRRRFQEARPEVMPVVIRTVIVSCVVLGQLIGEEWIPRESKPWDTCYLVEGKVGGCGADARSPMRFRDFFHPDR